MNGRLIVFEGTDGSGKATQSRLLCEHLQRESIPYKNITFPRYGKPSAAMVQEYLDGNLGRHPGDVNAYAASLMFSMDRYASYKQDWGAFYEAGGLVIADRYTTSNAVHQASKLPPEERTVFLNWLFELEYGKLGLPKPDLVLFLSLPLDLSQKLLSKRYDGDAAKKDIHEADLSYLEQCNRAAAYAGAKLGWQFVEVSDGAHLYPIEQIRDDLARRIQEALTC